MSDKLIQILIVAYVVILFVALYEKNYPRALYWLGAILLSIGVLWGIK